MSGSITGFIAGGMTSNHCFVAGTVVITVAGKKAIEYIREGDLVLSEDPDTGDVTYKKALETYINEATELIHLNIDGEEIVTTPAHPFYVKDKGFIQAGDLIEGSILVDSKGNVCYSVYKLGDGIESAVASHEENLVTITNSKDVDEALIKATVTDAGYKYAGIA